MDAGQDVMSATAEVEDDGVHFAELLNLEIMIEKVSTTTNEYLIRTLNEKYHLLDHCRALKRYLLLGQVRIGRFVISDCCVFLIMIAVCRVA